MEREDGEDNEHDSFEPQLQLDHVVFSHRGVLKHPLNVLNVLGVLNVLNVLNVLYVLNVLEGVAGTLVYDAVPYLSLLKQDEMGL